jgi:hypothetical protein
VGAEAGPGPRVRAEAAVGAGAAAHRMTAPSAPTRAATQHSRSGTRTGPPARSNAATPQFAVIG